eukprot:TRINITY_DN110002_c0_g1_i1.p1 TRINITY_DN110002_c0_g1~~TRINITY_DN110002_c0_g1_i1.p1  ORF type:complete len:277 (+),score=59.43 TRINITY_DN110002_c0_g1_i1:131-961(+)
MASRRSGGGSKPNLKGKELSVIVPTYNETENLRPLAERLFKTAKDAGLTVELLIVDDESPGSEESERISKELAGEGLAVRLHRRYKKEGRGLSSAVLLGFKQAKYPVVLCMDADLQHEPESVPDVAGPVLEGTAEFSIGSRHVEGGGLGFEWSLFRRIVSKGATLLAWGVARSTDPMSGFFCVSKETLKRGEGKFNTIGFKIGLEIMARCQCNPVQDVGITFQERIHGESKLSAKQYQLYLEQLGALYWAKYGIVCLIIPFLILLMLNMMVMSLFN